MKNTHKKPGHSKANKSLTVSEYKQLLQFAAVARALIAAKHDRLSVGKVRVFTEPRKGGLRTKLWGCGFVKPQQVNDIQDALTKRFPQLTIKVEYLNTRSGYYSWSPDSLAIYMRVKPDTFTSKPAPAAKKLSGRLSGSPLIMQSAIVDVATIPDGTISIESQFHISAGSDATTLDFELVDSWLVIGGNLVPYGESDRYHTYLEMHLGCSMKGIYKAAADVAEEVVRKSVINHTGYVLVDTYTDLGGKISIR